MKTFIGSLLVFASAVSIGSAERMVARPQTAAAPLKFETVSVKVSAPNAPSSAGCHGADAVSASNKAVQPGQCVFRHVNLRTMIMQAYPTISPAAKLEESVTGGPEWIDGSMFDVAAQAADPSTVTMDQIQQMLQTLLKDRFQLVFHTETRTVPGYFMLPVSSGLKLTEVTGPPTAEELQEMRKTGIPLLIAPNMTLASFANLLAHYVKEPIVDKTNIQGQYNFVLDSEQTGDAAGPSIFTALQEEIGLKLESDKVPVNIFVIDHAEKPDAAQ